MKTQDCADVPWNQAAPRRHSFEELIVAGNRNETIKDYRAANAWWSVCWREEVISLKPPIRVEFEHAIVFATFSEALSLRKSKSGWGAMVGIEPLRADDHLHPTRVTYQLKPSSKVLQRWQVRDSFKAILGKDRRLVTDAMHHSKKEFLQNLDNRDRSAILTRLDLRPAEFWRAVRRGEMYGPNGIHGYVKRLKERTEGYEFEFPG